MPQSKVSPILPGLAAALGLASILAPGAVPVAEACSCASLLDISHPCESYHERSVVFLGRAIAEPEVREDSQGWGSRTYRFAVEEPFNGVTGPTVEVVTGMGGGDCGVDFEVDRRTFVHAWYPQSGKTVVVGLCGTNSTRDLHGPDVAYARARAAGEPEVAIFGRVTGPDPAGGVYLRPQGVGGVTITAVGPGGETLTTTTDDDGRFEFPRPLQGRYTVRVEPPGEGTPVPAQEVEVEGRRCRGVEFEIPG